MATFIIFTAVLLFLMAACYGWKTKNLLTTFFSLTACICYVLCLVNGDQTNQALLAFITTILYAVVAIYGLIIWLIVRKK